VSISRKRKCVANTTLQFVLFEAVENRDILLNKPRRILNRTQEFRMNEWNTFYIIYTVYTYQRLQIVELNGKRNAMLSMCTVIIARTMFTCVITHYFIEGKYWKIWYGKTWITKQNLKVYLSYHNYVMLSAKTTPTYAYSVVYWLINYRPIMAYNSGLLAYKLYTKQVR